MIGGTFELAVNLILTLGGWRGQLETNSPNNNGKFRVSEPLEIIIENERGWEFCS